MKYVSSTDKKDCSWRVRKMTLLRHLLIIVFSLLFKRVFLLFFYSFRYTITEIVHIKINLQNFFRLLFGDPISLKSKFFYTSSMISLQSENSSKCIQKTTTYRKVDEYESIRFLNTNVFNTKSMTRKMSMFS